MFQHLNHPIQIVLNSRLKWCLHIIQHYRYDYHYHYHLLHHLHLNNILMTISHFMIPIPIIFITKDSYLINYFIIFICY